MGLSNDLSCEAGSLSCCCPNPHGLFQSEVSGFISPCWSPGLLGLLCSPPFVWFICARMWGRWVLPTALPAPFSATLSLALSVYLRECGDAGSASGQTACPVGPTLRQSGSCHGNESPLHLGFLSPPFLSVWKNVVFFFNLLGVGLPCRSIFCPFWLWEEAQCVYLCRHLGSP